MLVDRNAPSGPLSPGATLNTHPQLGSQFLLPPSQNAVTVHFTKPFRCETIVAALNSYQTKASTTAAQAHGMTQLKTPRPPDPGCTLSAAPRGTRIHSLTFRRSSPCLLVSLCLLSECFKIHSTVKNLQARSRQGCLLTLTLTRITLTLPLITVPRTIALMV